MFFKWAIFFLMAIGLHAGTYNVCEVERTDTQKAKETIEGILEKEPNNAVCILQLANIYLKQGKIAQGFELIVQAYSIDPHNVKNSRIATVLPFALKVTSLKQQAARTNDKETWNQLGDGYFDMGIFNESIKMYKKSMQVDEMQHVIRLKLALSLQKSGQTYSAIEEVKEVLSRDKNHVLANYYMGKFLLYDVRDRNEALYYFRVAKEALIAKKDTYEYLEFTNLLSDISKELGE